jgi:uncharacterized membrane protein HdeD (DUF308 family)
MATTLDNAHRLKSSWIWLALFGVISLVGGVLALLNPFAATLAATLLAGWFFVAMGVMQIIHSFRVTGWGGFIWSLLFGVLALLVGLSLAFNPLEGMISLTLLLAVLLIVMGATKIMYAFSLRPVSGWLWVLVSGLLSIVLAGLILFDIVSAATTVLGILLGVELVSNGILFLLVAFGVRKLA